jgi:hypothetical protein
MREIRCPKCGVTEATVVCRVCKTDKVDLSRFAYRKDRLAEKLLVSGEQKAGLLLIAAAILGVILFTTCSARAAEATVQTPEPLSSAAAAARRCPRSNIVMMPRPRATFSVLLPQRDGFQVWRSVCYYGRPTWKTR